MQFILKLSEIFLISFFLNMKHNIAEISFLRQDLLDVFGLFL